MGFSSWHVILVNGIIQMVINVLQVKFTVDTIDETDALEEILKPRTAILGGKLTKRVLNGTHATPLAPVKHLSANTSFLHQYMFV
jgi:hypothetical protein